MRAKIKSTGEIVEVAYLSEDKYGNKYFFVTTDTRTYRETELEMMSYKEDYFYTYDYWEKLKHQYAGMAMQGLIASKRGLNIETDMYDIPYYSQMLAHALVEKLKEE